ncbi:hypothetical protein [Streptomyces cinereoruber]|uniref:hypothetical protein n=1 Tax=Streptomyces cinereoruber TaxID=67260 RepID=UPI000D517864|nr:hypothetical protein DBP18_08825 [Streptomyces sp. CS081A]
MDSPLLPRRTPGASGREYAVPKPEHGVPSRELRLRAASGWERFMRRSAAERPVRPEQEDRA